MMIIVIILILLIAVIILASLFAEPAKPENDKERGSEEWEYGDAWKQAKEEEPAPDIEYVDILRGDTGTGYDDSRMLDLVGYLGSKGIRAVYDSHSLAAEVGAMKTYILKVEAGKENEAIRYLKEKSKS